jgi:hypothetical protein
MQPLKMEPSRNLMKEKVKSTKSKVGAKPQVTIQNESTEDVV